MQKIYLPMQNFGKDGIQYVLRRDFTGNSAQMVQNFADVLSEQVSGNASCKSILGPGAWLRMRLLMLRGAGRSKQSVVRNGATHRHERNRTAMTLVLVSCLFAWLK